MVKSIVRSIKDLFIQTVPLPLRADAYAFGFLVHPRDEKDVLKKYPFLHFMPDPAIRFFTRWFWPVVLTKVTGLKTVDDNTPIDGYIISIPLISTQILENRPLAIKRIRRAIILAKRMGVKIIGLGALTASVTRGGEEVMDMPGVWITTGHAYTGYNVTQNLINLEKQLLVKKKSDVVAIVGAAGSIGSISAQILARAGYENLLLIDIERKKERVKELVEDIKKQWPDTNITESYAISSIKNADFIIAATNTPEALITPDLLKPGAVVIDDAQPSDVAYAVLETPNVLAIEAGVVHTPGVRSNFDLGLKGEYDNFCCMAEVLILASHRWNSNFVVKRTTLEFVDKIIAWGKPLNFSVAKLQNRKETITKEKLNTIIQLRKRTVQSYVSYEDAVQSRRR